MAIRTEHYKVEAPESRIEVYEIPGVSSPVLKHLNSRLKRVVQTGYADGDESTANTIYANKGDPSVIVNVDTLLQGTVENCYKFDARITNVPTGKGGIVEYEIIWQQIIEPS